MNSAYNHLADPDQVAKMVKLLKIDVKRLFAEAYLSWFGTEATQEEITEHIKSYQNKSTVPFWLRQHIRALKKQREATRKNLWEKRIIAAVCSLPYLIYIYIIYTFGMTYALCLGIMA